MIRQCKCGSSDFFMNSTGMHTGLYCAKCGKWQKRLSKDERQLYEHKMNEKGEIHVEISANTEHQ